MEIVLIRVDSFVAAAAINIGSDGVQTAKQSLAGYVEEDGRWRGK